MTGLERTILARRPVEVPKSVKGESNRVLSTEMTQQMLTPQLSGSAWTFRS